MRQCDANRADCYGDCAIHAYNIALFLAGLLEENPDWFESGVSEYSLIAKLQRPPFSLFDKAALRDPLILFQTHFVVFHALYQVRDRWRERSVGELAIHTLRIELTAPLGDTSLPEETDPLRSYYLNWDNFNDTGKDDVDALLNEFWQRVGGGFTAVSQNEIDNAKHELGLDKDTPLDLTGVKRQYRKLVHVHHPDKGGDEGKAKRLVHAFSLLSAHLREAR